MMQGRKAHMGQRGSRVLQMQSQKGEQTAGGVQQRLQGAQCQKACATQRLGNGLVLIIVP